MAAEFTSRSELLARMTRRGLYLVTDERLPDDALLDRLERALEAGADVVQLRDKRPARRATYELGRRIADRCRAHGALFIVNDFADLAVALKADGVHVGQDDLPPEAARATVGPDRIVGLSVSAVEEAVTAAAGDADYLGFGALFPTATKLDAEPAGPEQLAIARRRVRLPLVGIGGVTAQNLDLAIQAGADCVAVVSAVFGAADPAQATRDLLAAIDRTRAARS
ncbi:MAG: thiamine phosphate synthase [Chloroflexi bacterium]|nr:thiamine phosphate synthase [Chloroflexota bacterium]